jgi:4-oxalocrotonate tautomerase
MGFKKKLIKGEGSMPIITLEVGKLTKEQKKDIIKRFTDIACEITHIPKTSFYSINQRNTRRKYWSWWNIGRRNKATAQQSKTISISQTDQGISAWDTHSYVFR